LDFLSFEELCPIQKATPKGVKHPWWGKPSLQMPVNRSLKDRGGELEKKEIGGRGGVQMGTDQTCGGYDDKTGLSFV